LAPFQAFPAPRLFFHYLRKLEIAAVFFSLFFLPTEVDHSPDSTVFLEAPDASAPFPAAIRGRNLFLSISFSGFLHPLGSLTPKLLLGVFLRGRSEALPSLALLSPFFNVVHLCRTTPLESRNSMSSDFSHPFRGFLVAPPNLETPLFCRARHILPLLP